MAKATKGVPEGFHTITPQLVLDNAAQTIDWYVKGVRRRRKSAAASAPTARSCMPS